MYNIIESKGLAKVQDEILGGSKSDTQQTTDIIRRILGIRSGR